MQVVNDAEIFKEINDFEGYYVSNLGRVKSCKRKSETFIAIKDDRNGYLIVKLWKNNKQYSNKVHRLVAEAFIPNPNNLRDVNHKDENKYNNNVSNLEWLDHKDNINFGTHNERANKTKSKPILQLSLDGVFINEFYSSYEAQRQLDISESSINQCCNGKRKTAGGYIWKFKCC